MPTQILHRLAIDPMALGAVDATAKATILLCLAVLTAFALRRKSAAVRHRLWALTLAGLVALPALSWLIPGWQIAVLPAQVDKSRPATAPTLDEVRVGAVAGDDLPRGLAEREIASSRGSRAAEVASSNSPVRRSPPELPWTANWPAGKVLLGAWLGGALIAALPLLVGLIGNERRRRRARMVTDPAWLQLLDATCRQLPPLAGAEHTVETQPGLAPPSPTLPPRGGKGERVRAVGVVRFSAAGRAAIELRQSGDSLIPLTWGVFRPVILLPADAESWPEPVRRLVLLHELAHIRRHDVAVQILGRLAAALCWFHPLAWYALHRLRTESEHACDDSVVAAGELASNYAQHLLDLALCLRTPKFVAAVAMARQSALETRMHWLFDSASSHVPLRPRGAAMLLVAAALAVAGLAALRPGTAPVTVAKNVAVGGPQDVSLTYEVDPERVRRGGVAVSAETLDRLAAAVKERLRPVVGNDMRVRRVNTRIEITLQKAPLPLVQKTTAEVASWRAGNISKQAAPAGRAESVNRADVRELMALLRPVPVSQNSVARSSLPADGDPVRLVPAALDMLIQMQRDHLSLTEAKIKTKRAQLQELLAKVGADPTGEAAIEIEKMRAEIVLLEKTVKSIKRGFLEPESFEEYKAQQSARAQAELIRMQSDRTRATSIRDEEIERLIAMLGGDGPGGAPGDEAGNPPGLDAAAAAPGRTGVRRRNPFEVRQTPRDSGESRVWRLVSARAQGARFGRQSRSFVAAHNRRERGSKSGAAAGRVPPAASAGVSNAVSGHPIEAHCRERPGGSRSPTHGSGSR